LAAQTPPPGQPPTPTPQPPATMMSADKSPMVTVVGCVQKETDVLKKSATGGAGMGDEFVLTNSKLNPPPMSVKPETSAEPAGTSGSTAGYDKVYRVTGDKESELKSLVGKRV